MLRSIITISLFFFLRKFSKAAEMRQSMNILSLILYNRKYCHLLTVRVAEQGLTSRSTDVL